MKKTIKKSLALILSVLILIGTGAAGLTAFAADSTESVGTVSFETKFFRLDEVSGEWIETDRAKKGETLKARVYVDTDYYTNSGEILFFYDDEFFTDSYERGKVIETTSSEYYQNLCGMTAQLAFHAKNSRAIENFIKSGIFDEEFAQTHTCICLMYMFSLRATNQKLSGDEWLVEMELTVREDTTLTQGSVFTMESAFMSPDRERSFSNVPYGEEGKNSDENDSLYAVYVDIESRVNPVSTVSNVVVDANGGYFEDGGEAKRTVEREIGSVFYCQLIEKIVRPGYMLTDWCFEDGSRVDSDGFETGYEDITVVAQWTQISDTYTLTLYANGGIFDNGTDRYEISVKPGETVDLPTRVYRDGYVFNGWVDIDGCVIDSLHMPEGNVFFEASWEPVNTNSYTVTFWYDEDGTSVYLEETYQEGEPLAYPAPPSKQGYAFDSWSELEGVEITGDLDVYPTYAALEYNVTVNGIYGDAVDGWIAYYGDEVTLADLYSKAEMDEMLADNGDYYTFECWNYNGVAMTASTVITVTDDVVIEGVFTPMQAKLIFEANGALFANGEATYEVALEYDEEITADMYPAIPEREGYSFKAWSLDLIGQPMDELEKTITITWVKNRYNVNYYVDGVLDYSVSQPYGAVVDASIVPDSDKIPAGYTFVGWSLDEYASEPGALGTVGVGGVNAYAVFAANTDVTYTVEIYKETFGSNYELADTVTYSNGVTGEFASFYVTDLIGFTFNSDLSVVGIPVAGDGSTVLVLYYDRNAYSIATYADGEFYAGYSYLYGEEIKDFSAPQKVGFTFDGWVNKTTGEKFDCPVFMPAENFELEAVWVENQYTVTYETGNGDVIEPEVYAYGEIVNLPELFKTGYEFGGWLLDGEPADSPLAMPDKDINLVACWIPSSDTRYAVKYYLGKVSGYGYDETIEYLTGTTDKEIIIMPKIPDGFTFDIHASVIRGVIAPDGSSVFEVVLERNSYNVITYDGGAVFDSDSYLYGATVSGVATPEKIGFTFDRWVYLGTEETVTFPITMPAANVELEAVWVANEYTVSFDTAGGETIDSVTVAYGEEITLPTAKKTGHTLAFWRDSDGIMYAAGKTFKAPAKDVVFTAVWLVQSRTVTYIIGGETVSFNVIAGEAVPQPDMSTYANAELICWLDANGNATEIPDVMPETNLTFVAKLRYAYGDNPYGITAEFDDGSFACGGNELAFSVEQKELSKESGGIVFGGENYKQLALYGVGFSNSGAEIQPENGKTVEIRIPVPAAYKDGTNFLVINRFSDGTSQQIPATKNGNYIVIKVSRLGDLELCVKSETVILTAPDKVRYNYKDALSLSGLTLEVYDANGNRTVISDTDSMTVNGYNPKKIGTQLLTVEYDGTSAQFEVTVAYAWWQILIRIFLLGFLWY